jgi:hypothetical protein
MGGQSEGADGNHGERHVGDERAAEPNQCPGHDRSHRGGEPVEDLVEAVRELGLDVEDRQSEHEQETRQHEAQSCKEPAQPAAAEAAEEHAELVRLRPRKDLIDGQRLLERLFGDPALLVDALALDHRDLGRRTNHRRGRRT